MAGISTEILRSAAVTFMLILFPHVQCCKSGIGLNLPLFQFGHPSLEYLFSALENFTLPGFFQNKFGSHAKYVSLTLFLSNSNQIILEESLLIFPVQNLQVQNISQLFKG